MLNREQLKKLDILPSDDGYHYWFPENVQGCLSANTLRQIADFLDNQNEAWDHKVQRDLASSNPDEKTYDEIIQEKVDYLRDVVALASDSWSEEVEYLLDFYENTLEYVRGNTLERWILEEYEFAKSAFEIVEKNQIIKQTTKTLVYKDEN